MDDAIVDLEATDLPVDWGDAATAADADAGTDVPLVPDGFQVTDAVTASWVCRKIGEARARAKAARAWCDREVARARRDEDRLLYLFGRQLQEFTTQQFARLRGRRRSVDLPGGKVGYRRVGPTLIVDDPDALLAWAKARCAAAVSVKESFSKSAVNGHFEQTGEVPDGSHVEPAHDRFFIA